MECLFRVNTKSGIKFPKKILTTSFAGPAVATATTVATTALPDRLGGDAHVVVLRELRAVEHCRPATHSKKPNKDRKQILKATQVLPKYQLPKTKY